MSDGYLSLPGSGTAYVQSADKPAFDISPDIDIRVDAERADWQLNDGANVFQRFVDNDDSGASGGCTIMLLADGTGNLRQG